MKESESARKRFFPSRRILLLIIAVAATTIALSTLVSVLLSRLTDLSVPSFGTIKTINVEAYWDESCLSRAEAVDWGTILPGSSRKVEVYLRSVSNVISELTLNTSQWSPSNVSEGMTLSWDYKDLPVDPGEVILVTLTLSASDSPSFIKYLVDNDVQQFNFTIAFSATEHH